MIGALAHVPVLFHSAILTNPQVIPAVDQCITSYPHYAKFLVVGMPTKCQQWNGEFKCVWLINLLSYKCYEFNLIYDLSMYI